MIQTSDSTRPPEGDRPRVGFLTWLAVAAFVALLLVGVGAVGAGFKWLSGGAEGAERIFNFATNPLVGVILGTLATALVQSSSTVTSVIVGLVAGGVPVAVAVPMIMGSNMGTTITNTIVSMGSLGDRGNFNRAFQASTVHDFFNLFSIIVFLPVEILFHPLERSAGWLAGLLGGGFDASLRGVNVVGAVTGPPVALLRSLLGGAPDAVGGSVMIVLGIAFILVAVLRLGSLLRAVMTGQARSLVERSVGRGPLRGILSGAIVTVMVQSSSTTTSLVVPLAAAGVLTLRQVYPFTLGANIGTCITAVLAATAVTGAGAPFAVQIALVHLLYNVFGVVLFMAVPFLRELPPRAAAFLGERSERNRGWAFGYLLAVFFVLPAAVLGIQAGTAQARLTEGMDHRELTEVERAVEREDMRVE